MLLHTGPILFRSSAVKIPQHCTAHSRLFAINHVLLLSQAKEQAECDAWTTVSCQILQISRGDAVDSMPPRSFAKPFCFSILLIRSDFKWWNSKRGVDASAYQLTLINPQRGDTLREFFIWPVFKATPKTCATKTENPEARPVAWSRWVSGRASSCETSTTHSSRSMAILQKMTAKIHGGVYPTDMLLYERVDDLEVLEVFSRISVFPQRLQRWYVHLSLNPMMSWLSLLLG